ncbi:hypothetical protein SAMN05216548_1018 [Faunimonas pinastri]|uniref:Uncharacterized protein n=1 Tax=Faunimonas pinastri TaxID=1855383 RepID=A0A1H8Z400_9HYPH|nr:hypothetical protein [Faunimonas pinastri]SEP58328.1 hypothetical protein SAMN05216548_1018 [Faunimonas pinastri]
MSERSDEEKRSLAGHKGVNGDAIELPAGKTLAAHQLPGQTSPQKGSERPDGAVASGGATEHGGTANVGRKEG